MRTRSPRKPWSVFFAGDFARANPERGRFRDLLKVAVRNMVRTYWSRKQRRTGVPLDVDQLPLEPADESGDEEWNAAWRRSLLQMTWAALEAYERSQPGSVVYTVLRLRGVPGGRLGWPCGPPLAIHGPRFPRGRPSPAIASCPFALRRIPNRGNRSLPR